MDQVDRDQYDQSPQDINCDVVVYVMEYYVFRYHVLFLDALDLFIQVMDVVFELVSVVLDVCCFRNSKLNDVVYGSDFGYINFRSSLSFA
jgi:hypothetical protein